MPLRISEPHVLLSAQSMVQSFTSAVMDLRWLKGFSILAAWTAGSEAVKTFLSGVAEETDITCVADVSGSLNSTYFTIVGRSGGVDVPYYVWFNVNSAGVDPEVADHTGIEVALSTDATNSDVAINLESALNAFPLVFDVVRALEVVTVTNMEPGAVDATADGTAATGFTFSQTAEGVDSDIDLTANTVTVASHGLVSGAKLAMTSDDTLPTGIPATAYAIVVDENTLAFADTVVHALAGTKLDITTYGAGEQTLTPAAISGALKLEVSNSDYSDPNRLPANPIWVDITGSSVTVEDSNEFGWNVADANYAFARLTYTATEGTGFITAEACAKDR